MLKVRTNGQRILVGEQFSVSFQRTLRIPEDDQTFPLPPSLGPFSIHQVADFSERVPEKWRQRQAFFIAMYQREALWLGFAAADWKPNAVKVAIGGVNAVSGSVGDEGLNSQTQNYLVCPDQPWLDGINAGDGFIRQFVAAPLGANKTVEAQITGRDAVGGIQLVVYEPKLGRFPDSPPERALPETPYLEAMGAEMGLAPGGRITQKIYSDPYGVDVWDQQNCETLYVYILNGQDYRAVSGLELPPTPVSVETYAEYGLPWFELYDESMQDVPAPGNLAGTKTMTEGTAKDAKHGINAGELPTERLHLKKGNRTTRFRIQGDNRDE